MIFVIYLGVFAVFATCLKTHGLLANSTVMLKSKQRTSPKSTQTLSLVGTSTLFPTERGNTVSRSKGDHEQVTSRQLPIEPILNSPVPSNVTDYWQTLTTTSATYSLHDEVNLSQMISFSFTFDIEAPIKTMRTFCPRTSACPSETLAEIYENIGPHCCLPCDCSDRCVDAGNCCFDKTNGSQQHQLNGSVPDIRETCVQTFIAGSDYGNNYMNSSFLLFQTCVDIGDDQTTMKCLQPNVFEMSEMTPVFSHNSGRHYRNIYCAQCSNDSWNVVAWQTRLQCRSMSDITIDVPEFKTPSDFSPRLIISMNPNCVMLWDPPINEKGVSHCFTNSDIVSECNKPGLDSLCQKYYFPVKGGNKIFRNIFCMECLLPSNLTGEYAFCHYVHSGFMEVDFSSLVSLNTYPKKISQLFTAENKCSLDRTYNKELDACIIKTCPVTEAEVIGGCLPLFTELSGISLDYRLKILYPKNIPFLPDSSLSRDENILKVVGISTDLDICSSRVYGVKVNVDFVEVNIQVVKLVLANRINIKESYLELENDVKAYNEMIKGDNNAFGLQIDTKEFAPMADGSVSFAKFSDFGSQQCQYSIAMSMIQFCDIITFLEHEFEMHDNGNMSVGNIMFVPGEFILRQRTNGTVKSVQMCLDHYISRLNEVTNWKYNLSSAVGLIDKASSGNVIFLSALVAYVVSSVVQK